MTMQEENLHVGGKWETMNFLGVVLWQFLHHDEKREKKELR